MLISLLSVISRRFQVLLPNFGLLVSQSITVPCSERGDQKRIFTFGLTNVASDRLQGTFDCVQQLPAG